MSEKKNKKSKHEKKDKKKKGHNEKHSHKAQEKITLEDRQIERVNNDQASHKTPSRKKRLSTATEEPPHSRKRNLEASGLASEGTDIPTTPFENVDVVVRIALPPSYIGNVRSGVDSILNDYVMKYRDDVDGVILAYSNATLVKNQANILNETPYILFSVKARALLFRPQKGMTLKGRVNKVGSNHIGMLVSGIFNASISGNEVSEGFVFNPHKDAWTNEDGSTIKVGDEVTFRVITIHKSTGIISISGTLKPSSPELESQEQETAQVKKKKRKKNTPDKRKEETS